MIPPPGRVRLGGWTIVFVLVGVLAVAARASPPRPGHRLSMRCRPAVVRIHDGCAGTFRWKPTGEEYHLEVLGAGPGFFVHPAGFVVTNAHVVEWTNGGEAASRERLFRAFVARLARASQQDPARVLRDPLALDAIRQQVEVVEIKAIHTVVTPAGAEFPFEVRACGDSTPGHGRDVAVIKIQVENAPTLKLGDLSELQILDPLVAIGYPAAAESEAFTDGGGPAASFTEGTLSALRSGRNREPILQLSAPTSPGSSGGPVVSSEGEVLGLVTFATLLDGQHYSGFTFAVSVDAVRELLRQASVANEQGPTDRTYQQALELFWEGQYDAAAERFREVQRLFPIHSEAPSLLSLSQRAARQGQPEDQSSRAPSSAPGNPPGGAEESSRAATGTSNAPARLPGTAVHPSGDASGEPAAQGVRWSGLGRAA